jgi:Predicted membrane protein
MNIENNKQDNKPDSAQQKAQDAAQDVSKQAVKEDAKGLLESLKTFLYELFDFRHDADHEATIDAIKADIPFKGATAWILIFAVFVASIGLNANSTAVVIGAMLISPLMGPYF